MVNVLVNTFELASQFEKSGGVGLRILGVYIKPLIGRGELGGGLRPIGAYAPVGIVDADYFHLSGTFRASQGVHLIDFLDQLYYDCITSGTTARLCCEALVALGNHVDGLIWVSASGLIKLFDFLRNSWQNFKKLHRSPTIIVH